MSAIGGPVYVPTVKRSGTNVIFYRYEATALKRPNMPPLPSQPQQQPVSVQLVHS